MSSPPSNRIRKDLTSSDGQVSGAMGCVGDACSQETAQGNVYQAHYIINVSLTSARVRPLA